jgi:energy-coupling factor transporter ATP-binding protein EcfA2
MSLSDLIRVNTHYTRSINMERDVGSLSVVESYIPTTRALRTLDSMVEAFKADESPRAWSLVGPYGSGKSSFAVFLAQLLSNPSDPATKAAIKKLRGADAKIARKYTALNRSTTGYCTVLLTGSPESLGKRLIESLAQTADEIWSSKCGRSPAIVESLWSIVERKDPPSTTETVACIEELQDALTRIGYSGLLIVIDELGKFLEYEARHYGANDIYLLQALAEHALAWHETKLSLVVMLHQAFEQYARGLGESLRSEWAKVQGRFENIPFLESAEQVLRVVAAAVEQDLNESDQAKVTIEAEKMAEVLAKSKALPGTMDETTASGLFARCYPLHPVSALLLPLLCQKVAQNERTLFSYLGSREAHGFQDSISRCQKVGDWIYPWEIYEYFILNQSAALSDHFTHRRWAEVVTATERLGDAQADEAHILKAVGLLNIIGAQGNFKASKDVVALCLPRKMAVDRAIKGLSEKSIIQYRKFSAEYRVWQGSDFDLDANIEAELEKIGRFGLAESLNRRHSLLPIIARKYSIQSGALRYFYPTFVDAQTRHQLDQNIAHARVVFYLAESKGDEETFKRDILDPRATLDIRVLCLNSDQLRETTAEVLALEEIQKTAQALNSDPVAQREFKDRYTAAVAKEVDLLDRLTSEPQLNHWY